MGITRTSSPTYFTCTYATRPSAPSEGQVIYETDTNLTYYYDGNSWRLLGQQMVGYTSLSASSSTITIALPPITNGLHLHVQCMLQSDTSSNDATLQPNGDNTSGNYFHQYLYGQNTSVLAGQSALAGARVGILDNGSTYWSLSNVWIFNYAGSGQKTIQTTYATPYGLSTSAIDLTEHCVWKSSAAISSIVIRASTGNFRANSFASVQVIGNV